MFQWYEADTFIILTGVLCALACVIPGTLLVLRGMSMMGDAISHTVLPGIAIAFLITHSREPLPMFVGAIIIGILTAFLVQWVRDLGKTDGGTAMGIVFTTLFAIGLILIRRATDAVDLDPSCVLYGAVELSALDTMSMFGMQLPRSAVINGGMFIVNVVALALFYKEFKISSFDPALATSVGINAKVMHYFLMILTAATAVAAFESVGTILVIAMLIVPPATALLLTDRFGLVFVIAAVIAILSAVLGHLSAITVPTWFGFGDTVTAGMMAFMAGVLFLITWLVAPRHGMLAKAVHRTRLQMRMLQEDILGILYRIEELKSRDEIDHRALPAITRNRLAEILLVSRLSIVIALFILTNSGQIQTTESSTPGLTQLGRRRARRLVRSHRLWETYLVEVLKARPDHTHRSAHGLEHLTELSERLDIRLGRPILDPHGKAIPLDQDSVDQQGSR